MYLVKTRGVKYFSVETWILFFPPYQTFWLRACHAARQNQAKY